MDRDFIGYELGTKFIDNPYIQHEHCKLLVSSLTKSVELQTNVQQIFPNNAKDEITNMLTAIKQLTRKTKEKLSHIAAS